MRKSSDLYFVSSNRHKFKEAEKILSSFGIELSFFHHELQEIQSDSLKEIARFKAAVAYKKLKKPLIIEDDGLFVDSLGGFPGPYSSYVFGTIGNDGILQLLKQKRNAKFVSIITFCNKKIIKNFEACVVGTISKKPKGDGWGYNFHSKKFFKNFCRNSEQKRDISQIPSIEKIF